MKEKKYLVLYYVSFFMTLIFTVYSCIKTHSLYELEGINTFGGIISGVLENTLAVINIIIVIIFTVLFLKSKKIAVDSLIHPTIYLIFLFVMVVLCFLFNNKVIISYMHFDYYLFFINIGYLFLNVYSLLIIKYKKNKQR